MRIVVHIGLYKTGTTAIQQFFAGNRSVLSKNGFLYPAAFTKFDAHHPLPWALGVQHRASESTWHPEEITNAIFQEAALANAHTLILSSEEFVQLGPVSLQRLKGLFTGHKVEIVVYLRRQDSLLLSSYGQHVRMYSIRFSGTIFDFVLKHSNVLLQYNYWALLQRWAKVFGTDVIRVKVYEHSLFPNGNVVADFAEAVGIGLGGCNLHEARGINRNLNCVGLEVLRRLNSRTLDEETHQRLIQLLEQSALGNKYDCLLLSYRNRQHLMAQFEQSNARVAKHWLGRDDGVLFENLLEASGAEGLASHECSKEELVIETLISFLVQSIR